MFFYWQMNPFGAWMPVKSMSRPGAKAEGKGPKVSGVVEIKPEEADFTLSELAMKYPRPKEESSDG